MNMKRSSQRGSAIMMLFIVVALFGLLAFAFMRSTGTSTGWLKKEQSKAATTNAQDCTNAVNMAIKRLEIRGCGALVSYNSDGTNSNAGAPTDGSCSIFHSNGGGVKPCNASAVAPACSTSQLQALSVGQSCGDAIHVGNDGGRLYAARADLGPLTFDNGSGVNIDHNATSTTDGMSNTNILAAAVDAGAPYAAKSCRSLGAKWYMPSVSEIRLLVQNQNVGELAGTFDSNGEYWTSQEADNGNSAVYQWFGNYWSDNGSPKTAAKKVRCVRRD